MRAKTGILSALGAIAISVTLAGATTPVAAQETATVNPANLNNLDPNLAKICGPILDTKTIKQFKDLPLAWDAYNNDKDPCHEVAVAQYALLTDNQATGAISTDTTGGYTFGG